MAVVTCAWLLRETITQTRAGDKLSQFSVDIFDPLQSNFNMDRQLYYLLFDYEM